MPTKRLTMRKIREILRLKHDCKLTYRQIAISCGIGRTTVSDYLSRFEAVRDHRNTQVIFTSNLITGLISMYHRLTGKWDTGKIFTAGTNKVTYHFLV